MDGHLEPFRESLCTRTHDTSHLAADYIAGLIKAERGKRNMERMAEELPNPNYQATQQFVTDSPWDYFAVSKLIGQQASQILNRNGWEDTMLLIDETGFLKKGGSSVGVSRQYSGTAGKVDNCQVAVFASLVNAVGEACLIDTRLYLPKVWADDEKRCIQAGIPEWHQMCMTKPQLALEMICEARIAGVKFGCIGGDGLYGDNSELCMAIAEIGETFLFDVHSDQLIWLARPESRQAGAVRVDAYAASLAQGQWAEVFVRDTAKGPLRAWAHATTAWVWPPDAEEPFQWTLILRNTPGEDATKYALTNAPQGRLTLQRMVFMQAQRYWIERCFQDAKSEMGLADYQVRKWQAWYHHMALVMLGMLFLLKERIFFQREHPLLSMRDLRLLMQALLDDNHALFERRYVQMEQRHIQRRKDIDRRRKTRT